MLATPFAVLRKTSFLATKSVSQPRWIILTRFPLNRETAIVPSLVDLPDTLAALAADEAMCLSSYASALSTSLFELARASRANDMGTGRIFRRAAMCWTGTEGLG